MKPRVFLAVDAELEHILHTAGENALLSVGILNTSHYESREKIMADCELLKGCLFFNDKIHNMPTLAEQFKEKYCRGDNSNCARYMTCKALGREKVPPDLFPNQLERAKGIIASV